MFIGQLSGSVACAFNPDEGELRGIDGGFRCQPAVEPFDDGDSIPLEKALIEARADDLLDRIEAVEIEMIAGKATGSVFVDQGKGGGVNPFGDLKGIGQPFDELGFASTEIPNEADDISGFYRAAEFLAEAKRFLRTV